jgi:lycopene cyclase domain-containing protein
VRHLIYLALLAACVLGTLPLEFVLGARVYRRPLRLLLTLLPVLVVFVGWDIYAIAQHHWSYDRAQTSGVLLPGRLPLEEFLFFVVVPICSILTLEAVRTVRGWPAGDEPGWDK